MDHTIACLIGKKLSTKKVIDCKYEEVYIYGLELIISFISSILLIFAVALITDQIPSAFIFISIFVFLRRVTGGYHANTHLKCKLCTLTIYSFHLLLTCITKVNNYSYIILGIIGIVVIFIFAPIENPNKPISAIQKKKFKILSILFFSITLILGFFISILNSYLGNSVYYTLMSVIALMIIPKITRRKKHEVA